MPSRADIEVVVDSIALSMSVVDVDSVDSRLTCWKIQFCLRHPTGSMCYDANDVWIENADFDLFVSDLNDLYSGSGRQADLRDIPGKFVDHDVGAYFVLRFEPSKRVVFEPNKETIECTLMVREPYPGEGGGDLKIETLLPKDRIPLIARAFESFPKWW